MTRTLEQRCQEDHQSWQNGTTGEYCGFQIKPKKDFGTLKLQAQPGCETLHGWIVIKDGCLATPGGTWSYSFEGARRLICALVAAGLGKHGHRGAEDAEGADKFHALCTLTREIGPDWEISEAMRMARVRSFSPSKNLLTQFWEGVNAKLKDAGLEELTLGQARDAFDRYHTVQGSATTDFDIGVSVNKTVRSLAAQLLATVGE